MSVDVLGRKSILRGVCVGYIYLGILGLSGLILTPIMLRYLGQVGYGLWVAFSSLTGYFMLLNFGMNAAATKYTAEYLAKTDSEALNQTLSSVFMVFTIIGAVVMLVSAGLSPLAPRFFAAPEELATAGSIAFLIMGSTVALRLAGSVFSNVIYGQQRVDVYKGLAIVQLVSSALFTIIFLYLGLGLVGVAVAAFLSFLLQTALSLIFVHRASPEIDIRPRLGSIRVFKEIGPYSIRSFVLGLTARIMYQTDSIVIGIFLGAAMVTPYAVAYTLMFNVTYLFSVIPETLFPKFSQLYALGNIDELQTLFLRATRIPIAIMVPVGLCLAFWGRDFIGLWVGEGNFVGMGVLIVLVAMQFLHASVSPAGLLLQGIGENERFTYSEIINAVLNLILSIVLVQRMGILGVALGTLVAHLVTSSWVVPRLACKYTRLPVHRYILSGILPPVLAGIPAGVITWVVEREIAVGNSLVELVLNGLLLVAIYAIIYLAFAANREERRMCLSWLKGIARA